MAALNKVMLIGNLTREPEIRQTPKGATVGELGLAINQTHTTQDGQKREEVTYVDVVVWNKTAENCKQYLHKGSPLFVEGSLQLDQWETQQGEKRSRLRVRGERVQFLGSRPRSEDGGHGGGYREQGGGTAPTRTSEAPVPNSSDEADDEIPF